MSPDNYKAAFEALKKDLLEARMAHRAALEKADEEEKRIADLRQSVSALARLAGETFEEPDDDEIGLTELVSMALKTHGGTLTAIDVKNRLEQLGYPQKSPNAIPSIQTVLRRLVLKGKATDDQIKDNKTGYRWIRQ